VNLKGTNNEEQTELSKEESRYIRARSRKLLFSMLSPMKRRLGLAAILVLFSTAMRVAGPALIALGIDWALPQAIEGRTGSLLLLDDHRQGVTKDAVRTA
jgi:ATP-binding cassette subfamily B protein